jgi:hypothetical protein
VKKAIAITLLAVGLLAVSCNRQKALDRIMADPQMKSYIMGEMLKSETTKAQLADSIFADRTITDQYINKLVANEYTRTDLFNRCLRNDPTGDWIIGKLAEDPNLKAKMKEMSK